MNETANQDPMMILAVLPKGKVLQGAQEIVTGLTAKTGFEFHFKRVSTVLRATDLITQESRWKKLRFIVIDLGAAHDSFTPGQSQGGASPAILKLKTLISYDHPPYIIGVSTNGMFSRHLATLGCDLTCDPDNLLQLMISKLENNETSQ